MNHLVIGDIHGCGSELHSLLSVVEAEYTPEATRIILIGDLLTKGPAPQLVVSEVFRLRQQGWQIELICGNHEIRLLGAIGRMRGGLGLEGLDLCGECLHALPCLFQLRLALLVCLLSLLAGGD